MKTTFDVFETNADFLILHAKDADGAFFAAADDAEQIAGYVYEIKHGASAADLINDYGSDEDAENDNVSALDVILDENKRFTWTGEESSIFFALLNPEEADFDTIISLCKRGLIPFEWREYSKADLFSAFFRTAVYNMSDDVETIEGAERAAYFAGLVSETLAAVEITEEEGKIYISLEHESIKTANSAAISEVIVHFFTCDFSHRRAAYEQHGETEFITLEKL